MDLPTVLAFGARSRDFEAARCDAELRFDPGGDVPDRVHHRRRRVTRHFSDHADVAVLAPEQTQPVNAWLSPPDRHADQVVVNRLMWQLRTDLLEASLVASPFCSDLRQSICRNPLHSQRGAKITWPEIFLARRRALARTAVARYFDTDHAAGDAAVSVSLPVHQRGRVADDDKGPRVHRTPRARR